MWNRVPASPASSTSTVDQQEIILDECQYINSNNINPISSGSNSNHNIINTNNNTTTINNHNHNHNNNNSNNNATLSTTSASSNRRTSPHKSRPKLFSSHQQLAPWKSLQHHFLRYSDVKTKREKRMTMAELKSEVLRRRNGWKVHHLVGQLSDLIQIEEQTRGKLDNLVKLFISDGAQKIHELAQNCHKLPEQYATLLKSQRSYGVNEFNSELIVTKIDDLLRGDLQRSNILDEQLRDCRELIVRITNEHRDRVGVITAKFNKRIQL